MPGHATDTRTPSELRAYRDHRAFAKWAVPILICIGGAVLGWAGKAAVLEHRVAEVEKLPPRVEKKTETLIEVKTNQQNVMRGVSRVEAQAKEINTKLDTLKFTNASRRPR